MQLSISEEIAHASRLSESEMRKELAIALFAQDRLTLSQAAGLAAVPDVQFQHILAGRRIPLHYGVAEFAEDIQTLNEKSIG